MTSAANKPAGPLEALRLSAHCEMCGANDDSLEPAFTPGGQAKTLCRDCRIGSAELLHDQRAELLEALERLNEVIQRGGDFQLGPKGIHSTLRCDLNELIRKAKGEA